MLLNRQFPKPLENQRDFGKVVKNKILGIDEEKKYDFNKLGNAHIYGKQFKLVSDSEDEESPDKAIDGLKLPEFFKAKVKIPDSIIKPIVDQKVQYMSRNDKMIEK